MIDWWLLYSLNVLAISMAIHTYVWYTMTEAKTSTVKSGECLICKIKSCVITRKGKNEDMIQAFMPPSPMIPINSKKEDSPIERAKKINNFGKILFVAITVLFNFIFWTIAIYEFSKPAEDYLTIEEDKET